MGNAASADLRGRARAHRIRAALLPARRRRSRAPRQRRAVSRAAHARARATGATWRLAEAPVRDGATVELRLANPAPVSWRLTFPDEADAAEWFALIDRIAAR